MLWLVGLLRELRRIINFFLSLYRLVLETETLRETLLFALSSPVCQKREGKTNRSCLLAIEPRRGYNLSV